jgi:hypothetical protein
MKRGKGVLLFGNHEPRITGYLIVNGEEYQIIGRKITEVRTELSLHGADDETQEVQGDLFDENTSQSGERKRDLV